MFKRIRWLGLGAAFGAASSLWAQRKARTIASRYTPTGVAGAAVDRARAAIAEGRAAMRQREAELRSTLTPPVGPDDRRTVFGNAPVNGHRPK